MAAKKRRKSPTRQQKNRKHHGLFSHILGCAAFLALGYAAVAGWWPDLMAEKTAIKTAHKIISPSLPQQAQRAPQTSQAAQPAKRFQENRQGLKNDEIRKALNVRKTNDINKPQQKPLAPTHTTVTRPLVPYKEDKDLPPEGQFGLDNAASRVFAKDQITVFSEKNAQSKIIATLKKGQEMRLYETDVDWQRIVVPSSDIIGWVMANSVTTTKPMAAF